MIKDFNDFKRLKIMAVALLILVALILILSMVTAVLAIWTESYSDEHTSKIDLDEFNPSLKYIIFSPLDSEGNFTSPQNVVSYAAVGYTGLVAELEIPSIYNSKPVTAILKDSNYLDQAFVNNQIITTITIPITVSRIGEGAFANLINLREVTILGDEENQLPITIGDYAFMGTKNLKTFNYSGRSITGNIDKIFFMSGYLS